MEAIINLPTFNNQSIILTILFGLSSGILALVGLVSIFISINNQHKIQKARELIWEIMMLPSEGNNSIHIGKKLFNKLWMYKDLTSDKQDFTKVIIRMTRITIILVSLLWFSLLIFLNINRNSIDFIFILVSIIISIMILIGFSFILGKINKIKEIGDLPDINDILNGDHKRNGINTLSLAGLGLAIKFNNKNGKVDISIGLPAPFYNISIKPTVMAYYDFKSKLELFKDSNNYELIYSDNSFISIDKKNSQWHGGSFYHWYSGIELNIKDNIKKIDIQLELHSQQGLVYAHYDDIIVTDILEREYVDDYVLLPDYCNEVAIKNTSDFAPWSIAK